MNKLGVIATIILLLLSGYVGSYAQNAAKYRIVMEITSSDTTIWRATIGSIQHLKDGWGNNVQIELVAHGAGINFLVTGKTTQENAIKALKANGVTFAACANTLKNYRIDKSQVITEAEVVPMGIGEIVMKEESGWSYIKTGY